MSTSIILCKTLNFLNRGVYQYHKSSFLHNKSNIEVHLVGSGRRLSGFIPNAEKDYSRKRSWWKKFFFDDDGDWFSLKDEDMLEVEENVKEDEELSEDEKFEAWKRRAEAIMDIREAQDGLKNEENRRWEDWLVDGPASGNGSSWGQELNSENRRESIDDQSEMISDGGLVKSMADGGLVKSMADVVFGKKDDMLYEDRVFQYASINSAKFLAVLVVIPWAMDFLIHDYVLMPFLDRYVKTVPLAAEIFDVRRHQKLDMVKEINLAKARYRLEVEIGKSPPLSDEELWLELRHKALELQDEWRLENRRAFANILSDMTFGISLFILLCLNQSQVALLKFTGYKILNNVSDTGKAFLIILITDIFLGYHSESGWQTLSEVILEHYGFQVDQAAITIFVCFIPVILDACVKLWLFKFLPRLSPNVSNIFNEMKRH
ncbi:chloroplast envelope membrane protein [Impatiens glandulifera]|uniref:chloroplast envelope membrane protein n=1 Tax=Impatiens glandulifera TaxID=253017 RepID=UPI001FB0543E|nr:chloroplast envelope membrane protein [Impatiens glandulifera]